jgi:hypothetical protein
MYLVVLQGFPFQPVEGHGVKQLVRAGCKLRYPPKITQSKLVIPKKERQTLEREIINASNLVALGINARTKLSSPLGFEVAFLPEGNKAKQFMSGVDSVLKEEGMGMRFGGFETQKLIPNNLETFKDRLDGLSLIAEALANSHPTGKFHEFIRLFERAFKASGGGLIAPLSAFLEASRFSFSSTEVERWIGLRDSATHADRRNNFSTAVELTPIIRRMEQAAYDVLCNKTNWRSEDASRRYLFEPTSGINSLESSSVLFIQAGTSLTVEMQPIDRFGVFTIDSQALDMQMFARNLTFLPMREKNE